jgi:hypothetical protein
MKTQQLLAYFFSTTWFLVILFGFLWRSRNRNVALNNKADVYAIDMFKPLVPLILVPFLGGVTVFGCQGMSIESIILTSCICLLLCVMSSLILQDRVEVYDDHCVSICSGLSHMLYYRNIRSCKISYERGGAAKITFLSSDGERLYFYDSIRDFHKVVDYVSGRAGISCPRLK